MKCFTKSDMASYFLVGKISSEAGDIITWRKNVLLRAGSGGRGLLSLFPFLRIRDMLQEAEEFEI